jgi:hypothetical protein
MEAAELAVLQQVVHDLWPHKLLLVPGLRKVPYHMVSHTTRHTTLRIIREY